MRQLEIEMAHQKVKYNTQITEGEASVKQLQRTHEREVRTLCVTYVCTYVQMCTNYAGTCLIMI